MPTIGELLSADKVEQLLGIEIDQDAPAKPRRRKKPETRESVLQAAANQRIVETARRKKKEKNVDLNNLPEAEVGRLVLTQVKKAKAKKVKEARPKAVKAKVKAEKAIDKGIKKDQKRRKNHVVKGFRVSKTLVIPDLDLRDVTSLDTTPSALTRGPYNQARFRLLGEPPLPAKGNQKDEPDPQPSTTYRDLIKEHERLRDLVKKKAKDKPIKAEAKPEVKVLTAKLNPSDKAKVRSLAKLAGISHERAREVLGV
jgi:hypothetical protein